MADRFSRDGLNVLPLAGRPHPVRESVAQLTHLLAVLLSVAAGLAMLAGMAPLAVAIVFIIVLNAAFAFWQEHRADRSTERLRSLLPQVARVVRDGRAQHRRHRAGGRGHGSTDRRRPGGRRHAP